MNSVERWDMHYERGHNKRHGILEQFKEYIKEEPESLLQRTLQQQAEGKPPEELEDKLLGFPRHLAGEGLGKGSAAQYYMVIRGYFRTNYVRLSPPLPQWVKLAPDYEKGRILTQEEAKAMVDVMDSFRDKAVIAFLAQTGQKIGIMTAVKHSEIKKEFDPHGLIEVPKEYPNRLGEDVNAESVYYKFVIGQDTMHLLKQFPKEWAGDWIFDLSRRTMGRVVDEAATKAGIQEETPTKLGEAWHLVHPETFRKYWRHQMKQGGVKDSDLLDYIMGYRVRRGGGPFTDQEIIDAYRQAEPYLKVLPEADRRNT